MRAATVGAAGAAACARRAARRLPSPSLPAFGPPALPYDPPHHLPTAALAADTQSAQRGSASHRAATPLPYAPFAMQAEHPPYDLPHHHADLAAEAFADLQASGLTPNQVLWHNLMDCQVKQRGSGD